MRALPLLSLLPLSCISVTDLAPDEGCRQARIALSERVWDCTGDDEAALAVAEDYDDTYTCRIVDWAGDLELDSFTSVDLVRRVSLEPTGRDAPGFVPEPVLFEATLACGMELRAQDCEVASLPVDDGRLLTLPSCGLILDAPDLDVIAGLDADGDGVPSPEDCDDADPQRYPGAYDLCWDGLDTDCDPGNEYDCDRDGVPTPEDCNDADPFVYPGAYDLCGDGLDTDCVIVDESDCDADGDGYSVVSGGDCDDANPFVHPGADDTACDGADLDCDGYDCCIAPNDCDGDGSDVYADCDDRDPFVYPGAPDNCHDGFELDCGTVDDFDCDGDGWFYGTGYGYDCDDFDPAIHPNAMEQRYDQVDSNCNGQIDF